MNEKTKKDGEEERLVKSSLENLQILRSLYDMRYYMQMYSKGERSERLRKGLLDTYALLANTPNIRKEAVDLIKSQVEEAEFNPLSYKKNTAKDDKQIQKNKQHNKIVRLLCRQIQEELEHQHKQGHLTDIPASARPVRIFIENKDGSESFVVEFEGVLKPISFKVKTYKTRHFSSLGVATFRKDNFGKVGLNQKSYTTLIDKGEKGIVLTDVKEEINKGKKYSATAYKKFLGMDIKHDLSVKNEEELKLLNMLAIDDQQSFLESIKRRTKKQQEKIAFFEALEEYSNPLKLLSQSEKLKMLFKRGNMKVDDTCLQDYFIEHVVKNDKANVWSKFVQKAGTNERFSRYDVLQLSFLSNYTREFNQLLNIGAFRDAKEFLKGMFSKFQNSMKPLLPSKMCAELLAIGIFKAGINKPITKDRLGKMNKLLNEFGINIDFKTLPVTKVPDDCIETAAQQMKISRADFDKARNTIYKIYNKKLQYMVQSQNISKPDNEDLHHYIALKYDGFVDRVLNATPNLVKTVREHPWNTDGHKLVHVFDTAGEFLVSDAKSNYYLFDFNALRKAFKQDKKLFIQAPILQIKQDGVFCDLLPVNNTNLGGMGCYISSDKTEQNYIKVPSFCLSEGRGGNLGKGRDGR